MWVCEGVWGYDSLFEGLLSGQRSHESAAEAEVVQLADEAE